MRLLFITFCFLFFGGCATKYSCGQFPKSGCQPVSSVFEKTNDGFYDYRKSLFTDDKSSGTSRRGHSKLKRSNRGEAFINVGEISNSINRVVNGDPILTKPVVLRVLITSFEDKGKDFNSGSYVYVRLQDSKWLINN